VIALILLSIFIAKSKNRVPYVVLGNFMFDYKLLVAFNAVIEEAGFEKAAKALGLTQSAVSRRVKLLEARLGHAVLVRETPPIPTEIGKLLLSHVQKVSLLEWDIQNFVPTLNDEQSFKRLRIALNADSLATWWASSVSDFCNENNLLLNLIAEDQEVSLNFMRTGEVTACIGSVKNPIDGARSILLGAMRYKAVATPQFIAKYFPNGITPDAIADAPALIFGPEDILQHRFLESLGVKKIFKYHFCPASEGFVRFTEANLGWAMIPELQIQQHLKNGNLVELIPNTEIDVPLYWHYWLNRGELVNRLTRHLMRSSKQQLIRLHR